MHLSPMSVVQLLEKCRAEAPWLAIALGEGGTKEAWGLTKNNPRIIEYISTFPYLKGIDYLVTDSRTHKSLPSGSR